VVSATPRRIGHDVLRGLPPVLYAAAAAYAAVTLWRFPPWTVDDAYITFRYAKHLLEHGTLTWNVGTRPVEGYTGIALPVLVAAGMRLGLAPERVARLLGTASLFFGGWTLRDNQRRLGVPEPVRAYVTATAMLFPALFAHATGGLETLLFAATLGACLGRMLECDVSPRPAAQAWLWAWLLVLSFIRPEGVLFAGAFGGALAFRLRSSPQRRAAIAMALAVYALPYGAYFAWRATYYGRLMPNTYYAKAVTNGFDSEFLQSTAVLFDSFLPLLAAGLALMLLVRRPVRVPAAPAGACLLALAVLTLQYSRSKLVMGYFFRFQVHVFFLVLPALGVVLASAICLKDFPRRYGVAKGGALAALVLGCLLACPAELLASSGETRRLVQRYLDSESDQLAPVGSWLREHLPPSESIACWVDAGIIPFIADDHVSLDFGRLNDAFLAHPGITRAAIADYFFAARPGALVVTTGDLSKLPECDREIIMSDPRFAPYEQKATFCGRQDDNGVCEVLFLRRGVTLR
jgi:hypothetical protein